MSEESELQELLGNLEGIDEIDAPVEPVAAEPVTEEPKSEPTPAPEPETTQLIEQEKPKTPAVQVTLDLSKIVDDHERDYREVMQNIRIDRLKNDTVISMLMEKADQDSARVGILEALVKACDTQMNSNLGIARVMDSRAKIVTALKGHLSGARVTPGGGGPIETNSDLEKMLNQDDDEV